VLRNWGDIYSKPFRDPFTVIDNLGVLKFEMLDDALAMMFEWLGLECPDEYPHILHTKNKRPPIPKKSLDEGKIKAMYDGKYAKHFGYEYHA
jgi:hypothetical protein